MSRFLIVLLCGCVLLITGCSGKPAANTSATPPAMTVDYDEKIKEIQEDPRIPEESKRQTIMALQQQKAAAQEQAKGQPAP